MYSQDIELGSFALREMDVVLPNRQVIDQQRKEASKSIENLPFMHVINITIIVSNIKVSLYSRINVFCLITTETAARMLSIGVPDLVIFDPHHSTNAHHLNLP